MKNWKMRSAIMVIVLVTTLIGIGALFLMASSRNQKALSKSTSDNMATYLTAQANTIENFVTEKENNLKLFGKSYDVRRVLLNEEDAQAQEQAQKYTMEYYNSLDNWEGLYIGNWDTTVLTYQNSEMIGKTLREGERLEELRNAMLDAQSGVYDAGIIVSPGTGKLPVYFQYGFTGTETQGSIILFILSKPHCKFLVQFLLITRPYCQFHINFSSTNSIQTDNS